MLEYEFDYHADFVHVLLKEFEDPAIRCHARDGIPRCGCPRSRADVEPVGVHCGAVMTEYVYGYPGFRNHSTLVRPVAWMRSSAVSGKETKWFCPKCQCCMSIEAAEASQRP